jgi:ribonuclease J
MFKDYLSLLLRQYDLVSISIDPLDLEALITLLDLSLLMGRNLVMGSDRLLWAIEEIERVRPEARNNLYVAEELETPTPLPHISLLQEVFKNPENYLLVIEPTGLLHIFRKLKIWGATSTLTGSVVVLLDPEPRESIKEVEEGALKTWLRSFGIQTLRIRLSGHYLPHQFNSLIEILKTKDIIPLHTEETLLMTKLFEKAQAKNR